MKTLIDKIVTTNTGLDALPLRVGAGVILDAHGAQKLFGWFGGYGLGGAGSLSIDRLLNHLLHRL